MIKLAALNGHGLQPVRDSVAFVADFQGTRRVLGLGHPACLALVAGRHLVVCVRLVGPTRTKDGAS
eukprot:571054-Amphidinium_carterae.1